jgi:nitroreductase
MQTLQALSVPAAIAARRSIRKYKPVPVPKADLNEILRLTSLAPSSANIQPWRFVAIQDPELQARLQGAAYGQAQVGAAPALIVLYVDVEDTLASVDDLIHPGVPAERRPGNRQMIVNMFANKTREQQHDFTTTQAGIALGFLVLAAQSLGYSTSVMGGFEPDRVRELLDLPEGVAIPAIVALGVADEAGYSTHRLPLDRLVRYIG